MDVCKPSCHWEVKPSWEVNYEPKLSKNSEFGVKFIGFNYHPNVRLWINQITSKICCYSHPHITTILIHVLDVNSRMAWVLTNSPVTTDIVDQSYGSDMGVTPKYASTCLFHEPLIIKPKFVLPLLWGSNQTPRPLLDPPRNDSPELVRCGSRTKLQRPSRRLLERKREARRSSNFLPIHLKIDMKMLWLKVEEPCKCREK